MDHSDIGVKQTIEAIDKLYPSPTQRAETIHEVLRPLLIKKGFSQWDLLCFCVSYVGYIAQSFPFIEKEARELNRLLHSAHYYDRESDPDKYKSTISTVDERGSGETDDNKLNVEGSELK